MKTFRYLKVETKVGLRKKPINLQVFYINLESRPDRLKSILATLRALGIVSPKRITGTFHKNGALGCARSHVKALVEAASSEAELILILEDDAVPGVSDARKAFDKAVERFLEDESVDVLCLGFSTPAKRYSKDGILFIGDSFHTTLGYAVKPRAIRHLINSFETSAHLLEIGLNRNKVAIDIWWTLVQKRLRFASTLEPILSQLPGYSDIEGKNVNYNPI